MNSTGLEKTDFVLAHDDDISSLALSKKITDREIFKLQETDGEMLSLHFHHLKTNEK